MATVKELAERVAALEAEVARLKAKVEAPDRSGEDWLDKVSGVFADDPDYLEIVRLGRKWRESFRPRRRKRQKN